MTLTLQAQRLRRVDYTICSIYAILCFSATRTSSQVTFPVDFFEHNQQLTEVEFGGNDLLQVYNGQQIKHRLNSTGMYVANTKVKRTKTMTMNISTSVTQFM